MLAPRHRSSHGPRLLPLILLSSLGAAAVAARSLPFRPADALVGGKVVAAPGLAWEVATVLLRDGVVEAVGPAVVIPPDAVVHDATGRTVYAGFIEPYAVLDADPEAADEAATALIAPQRRPSLSALADLAPALRRAGFTVALAVPGEGLLRGGSDLVSLGDGDDRRRVVYRVLAQHVSLAARGRGDGPPRSRMGAVALLRQTLLDARWQSSAAPRRPTLAEWPDASPDALAALARVVAGRQPLIVETASPLDNLIAAALGREFGITVWVVGNGDEQDRLEAIARDGLPHLLPLAFPEPPAIADPLDPRPELDALRRWDRAPANPAQLISGGLPVAFTSARLAAPERLLERVAEAIAHGLAPQDALAALTTTAARLFGVDDQLGTIAVGRCANLTVLEGELGSPGATVRSVWIDGTPYPSEMQPPLAGRWQLRSAAGEPAWSGELSLHAEPHLAGTLRVDDEEAQLTSLTAGDGLLEATLVDPGNGAVVLHLLLAISGDRATGRLTFGDQVLSVNGRRRPAAGAP